MMTEGNDLRRMLPAEFASLYELLWDAAYGSGARPVPDVDAARVAVRKNAVRVSSGSVGNVVGGVGPRKGTPQGVGGVIRDERAVALRQRVDRKLRALAREMNAFIGGSVGSAAMEQRQCAGKCKRMAENTWAWCPWCGGPTRTVD